MQTEIGNWTLGAVIGEGGMGTVYLARHKTLGTPAAFKVLAPALARDPRFRERFVREAKAHAQLHHPGIAQVIDFIEQGDDLYLIMEYLPGGTLAQLMENEKGPLSLAQALALTRRILSALDYAHQHRVIHRDIKPSNILFDEHGQPKLVDFGIALILDGRRLTTTGTLGTPHYMSPEQIRRPQEVDHRTDVYAMGVVLYEMLAGQAPFDGESDFDIRFAQVTNPPKPLRPLNPEVNEDLEAIVFRAMAKNPEERFGGCGAMERALGGLEGDGQRALDTPVHLDTDPSLPLPLPPIPVSNPSDRKVVVLSACCGGLLILLMIFAIAKGSRSEVEDLTAPTEQMSSEVVSTEEPMATDMGTLEAMGTDSSIGTSEPVSTDMGSSEPMGTDMTLSSGSSEPAYELFAKYEGQLAAEKGDDHSLTLSSGYEYRFSATCDGDCGDLDLYLWDGSVQRISDTQVNATPELKFSPEQEGAFVLRTWMYKCSTPWCYFHVNISRRPLGE